MRPFPYENEVYVGDNLTAATLVDNLLKAAGIDTVVAPPQSESRTRRSVYVLESSQLERARGIVSKFIRNEPLEAPRSIRSWRCIDCNELIEGQFDVCWKCGRGKSP
ncbi:MAG TPA: hypothetical protein VF219_14830 [Vicinamibacterales bacterium]